MKHCDSDEEQFLLLQTPDFVIPIIRTNSYDRGWICLLASEALPHWNEDELNDPLVMGHLTKVGLSIIEQGRGEYVLELGFDSFDTHRKYLTQVGRCWNRNAKDENLSYSMCSSHTNRSIIAHLVRGNQLYFQQKYGAKLIDDLRADTVYCLSGANPNLVNAFVYHEDRVMAAGLFSLKGEELYWINTTMDRTPSAHRWNLGNYVLLIALQYCYNRQPAIRKLNLGLDVFEYKKLWKPTLEYAPNLDGQLNICKAEDESE